MTQDEIIELARQAGLSHFYDSEGHCTGITDANLVTADKEKNDARLVEMLTPFAKLVAEREREVCAKIAEKEYQDAKTIEETHYKYSDAPFNPRQFGLNMDLVNQSKYLSFAIRARGQNDKI